LGDEKDTSVNESETYTLPLDALAKRLGVDLNRGLTQELAEERLRLRGLNIVPKVKPSLFRTYIAPFLNWLITLYLISSTVLIFFALFILPDVWGQVWLWLLAVAANAVIAIFQQSRAQRKIEALQRLSESRNKVVRDGLLMEIPSKLMVFGDVVKLEQGDKVPADARIISSSSLRVDEASLTGESEQAEKFEDDCLLEDGTPLSDRKNMVFLGTYITAGSAVVLIVKTGIETQLGKISKSLKELNVGDILLRKKINKLAKYLGVGVLILLSLSLTYRLLSLYFSNQLFTDGLLNMQLAARAIVRSVVTAMSITPINIPLLTTIILLTGVLIMAQHRVVVRDLNAVEAFGRVSVVCSDKTGTITKNEMTVKWICLPSSYDQDLLYSVTGVGFQPEGEISALDLDLPLEDALKKEPELLLGREIEISSGTSLECLLVSGMLNNDASIIEEENETSDKKMWKHNYKAIGDATDASILNLFHKSGLNANEYKARFTEACNYPFDSRLKRMTRVFKDNKNGRYVVFTKGATDVLLPRCTSTTDNGTMDSVSLGVGDRELLDRKADLFASHGNRIISLAFKYITDLPSNREAERELVENDLTYLGFVAIIDPPREGVIGSVSEANGAGIRTVMITGDSVETAKNIAVQVGISRETDLAVEGSDIDHLSNEDFLRTSVFARVSPEHKTGIVDRYRKQNRVVAMTGDGVNDAPAISMADVGISMGITGTEVAKQAADVIITDDSFNSIVAGIKEGRGLFHKIRSLIFFYVAINLAESMIYFGSTLLSPSFYLINTWQQLYVLLTAHSLPAFVLIVDHLSKDVMREKPRDTEEIFNKKVITVLLIFSISLSAIFYTVYFGTLYGSIPLFEGNKIGYVPILNGGDPMNSVNWSQAKARTMFLTVLLVAECTLILSLRRTNKTIFKTLREDNYWFIWPLILAVPIIHLVLMYLPGLQLTLTEVVGASLEVIPLTLVDWGIAVVLGLIPVGLLEFYKKWVY
jgi:P-type Ca2+ transporter type 2C